MLIVSNYRLDCPTSAKEAILMHRLLYDLQITAANSGGYYLNCYFDDVDHDGFDVIFDDQDVLKKIQVKSVRKEAKTNNWYIHKNILRPLRYMCEKFGFPTNPIGEGVQGGVILMEYTDTSTSLDINYYYTDLFVLMGFFCDVFNRNHGSKTKAIKTCIQNLYEGLGNELLSVPKTAFLESKNTLTLLSLIGLHGFNNYNWQHYILMIANNTMRTADKSIQLSVSLENAKKLAINEINMLSNDSFSI